MACQPSHTPLSNKKSLWLWLIHEEIKCKENIEMVIKVYSCILSSSNLFLIPSSTSLPVPSHFLFAFENHLKCKSYSNILQKSFSFFIYLTFLFPHPHFYSFSRSFALFFSLRNYYMVSGVFCVIDLALLSDKLEDRVKYRDM